MMGSLCVERLGLGLGGWGISHFVGVWGLGITPVCASFNSSISICSVSILYLFALLSTPLSSFNSSICFRFFQLLSLHSHSHSPLFLSLSLVTLTTLSLSLSCHTLILFIPPLSHSHSLLPHTQTPPPSLSPSSPPAPRPLPPSLSLMAAGHRPSKPSSARASRLSQQLQHLFPSTIHRPSR
jgi:hypothetical protein